MTYIVHELYKTLQGEGAFAGHVAVFCRFAGCNLWSGLEQDRGRAICKFCDTDFVGGRKYQSAEHLAKAIAECWGPIEEQKLVVFTGGEPMLQLDQPLVHELQERDFRVHIETNGTIPVLPSLDWVCVSPKAGANLVLDDADEVKLVYPQDGLDPDDLFNRITSPVFSLQPMDGPNLRENTAAAIEYVLDNPWWRLSIQMHKVVGLA